MKAKTLIIIIAAILVTISVFYFSYAKSKEPGSYDSFAKCLSENGVKFYGAYWCGHCNNQKQMFGKSFQYINYIECSLPNKAGQTQFCNQEGINGYPTWEFKSEERIEDEMTMEELSKKTGCEIQ